jgi:outer membrane protein assembly factor BamB
MLVARHLAWVCQTYGWEPSLVPFLGEVGNTATAVAIAGVLPLWWLFLSGRGWRVRARSLALFLMIVILFGFATVRKVRLSTDELQHFPSVEFRWERSEVERLSDHAALVSATAVSSLPEPSADVSDEDSPTFRGPQGEGAALHLDVAEDWRAHPPRLLWKRPCGGGFGGISIAGDLVFTLEQRGEMEAITCYDVESGRERWNQLTARHSLILWVTGLVLHLRSLIGW